MTTKTIGDAMTFYKSGFYAKLPESLGTKLDLEAVELLERAGHHPREIDGYDDRFKAEVLKKPLPGWSGYMARVRQTWKKHVEEVDRLLD